MEIVGPAPLAGTPHAPSCCQDGRSRFRLQSRGFFRKEDFIMETAGNGIMGNLMATLKEGTDRVQVSKEVLA